VDSNIKKEHRLRVFENRLLRRILGPKRDEVTEGWRKLRNEEVDDLYSSPIIFIIMESRRMRWAGHYNGPNSLLGNLYDSHC
jgi:hypothetical protein